MKIAIIHDWLVVNAGAEKVLKSIIELYPDADIFSLVDFLDNDDRYEILKNKSVKTTFIQYLPFAKKHFRNYLPLFPKAIESLDLSNYDIIISSSWAVAKGIKKDNNQIHICYCHTPIRYAWDLYEQYTKNLKQPKKFIVQQTLKYIRKWDLKTSNRVDFFIANSNFVAKRIKKTYKRDSIVIYPPVDINKFTLHTKKEDFYITVSRLVPYKKTKLIVEAFNEIPNKKLIVIGGGEELKSIQKIIINNPNIQAWGHTKEKILIQTIQQAKAFIYAAIEDFGITPIEAQACGTPVIALNDGGTAETVINGINGLHFEKQTKQDICQAISLFEKMKFDAKNIRNTSLKYISFKEKFEKFVKSKLS
jgi:glycosyltransferase involved in cell wall biosynthesis